MLAFIPFITLLVFYACLRRVVEGHRMALLAAATVWGVCVVVITEVLSVFMAIETGWVAAAWIVAALAGAAVLWRLRARSLLPASAIGDDSFIHVQVAICGVIAAMIGAIALLAPPNTVDVAAYHAPRVAMWMQHQSVAHYATSSLRQLVLAPFAEFIQLHFVVLTHGDRLMNASHWFSFVLSGIAVSVLAQKLGAGARAQAFAALLAVTIPQGLMTASGAKNDWTVTLWILLTAVFALRYLRTPSRFWALLAGSAACLAFLTKGTGLMLVAGVVLFLFLPRPALPFRRLATHLAASACVFVLTVPMLTRNYRDLGVFVAFPASVPESGRPENTIISPGVLYSNALRNASLHLITPLPQLTAVVRDTVVRLHRIAGIDPNNPKTTFGGLPYDIRASALHETGVPNNAHFALAVAAVILALLVSALRKPVSLRVAIGIVLVSCIAFCLLVKWMPWNTRLHLPMFVLASCVIAMVAERLPRLTMPLLVALVVVAAGPAIYSNPTRMLIGPASVVVLDRSRLYFLDRYSEYGPMMAAINTVRSSGCQRVGIDFSRHEIEYPVYPLLGVLNGERRVWSVGVDGDAAPLAPRFHETEPCAVICADCGLASPRLQRYLAATPVVHDHGMFKVLTK